MHDLVKSNEISTAWIESLALEELNMDETGIVNFHSQLNPTSLLDEASIRFIDGLRDRVEVYVNQFNQFRSKEIGTYQVKIFKIANTVNDFMVFRNSLRLLVTRKSVDLINIGFLSSTGQLISVPSSHLDTFSGTAHEIKAHVGPFNKITFRYNGELVDTDALVRYFLTEFIKISAR